MEKRCFSSLTFKHDSPFMITVMEATDQCQEILTDLSKIPSMNPHTFTMFCMFLKQLSTLSQLLSRIFSRSQTSVSAEYPSHQTGV